MKGLIRFVLKREVLVNLLFILLMVTGAFSLFTIPVDRYPNVNMGKVVITTFYPGASPEEVEALVTTKIEDALDDLENMEFVRSTSLRQRSTVVVKFLDDTDYQSGYDELRFKVLGILNDLPAEVDPPDFLYIDVDEWLPVVSVELLGERSNRSLTLMAEEVKIQLRQVKGVKEVKLTGEKVREFHLYVDPHRLTRLGITFDDVARALSGANVSIPAGDFTTQGGDFVVQADERFRSRQEVMETIIRTDKDGSFLRMADVADDARLDYRDSFVLSSADGKDCVTLQVVKTADGNALSIKEGVLKVLKSFEPSLKREKVNWAITQDSTVQINDAISTLGWNMMVGIFLVCAVIWYVMGFRNALVTTVGIPFSFLFTMIFMKITGNSLNEITLFSFVLVSGIIVDDAIIVVENIYRHVQEGKKLNEAVVDGTVEVFLPVIAATLTTIAAFLPMLIMTGSTGEFFALIPKAVSFALAASVAECLVILPLHYRDWGPKKNVKQINLDESDFSGEGIMMRVIRKITFVFMPRAVRHPWFCLIMTTLALAGAVAAAGLSFSGVMPLIRVKFFPDEYTLYFVEVRAPVGTPIAKTNLILKNIEKFVMADGPGKALSAKGLAGFQLSEDYEAIWGVNLGHVTVTLPSRDTRTFDSASQHLEDMRKRLQVFAKDGVRIRVRPEKGGPPAGKDLNIRAVGSNPEAVSGLAKAILEFLNTDPRLKGQVLALDDGKGQPSRVVRFKVKKERAAEFGLSPKEVILLASSVMDGRYVGKFRLVDEEVDFKLKLSPHYLRSEADALDTPLLEHPSGPVRLGDVASISVYQDQGDLKRYQGERAVTVTGNLKAGSPLSVPAVVNMVREHYENKLREKYVGANLSFAGEFEATRKSYLSLAYAFLVAIMLIYLILATQFSSYWQPLIILSAIPFALIGVIFGKIITQSLFTINSFIAIVGVAGVVVNDALVLIDFLNRRYEETGDRLLSINQAVHIRLRPILLTTLTTTLGLLPMALGIPYYSTTWGTMASTFVTGLCTSSALSIILVPVQWNLLMRAKEKWRKNER